MNVRRHINLLMDLRTIRLKRKLTQAQLAAKSGVDQATVSNLEAGKTSPSWETAYRIAKALGVKPQDIFPITEAA